MLFSATMPGPILTLARTFMTQPTHIRAEVASEGQTHTLTKQYVYRAHAMDKVEMLARVLQARDRGLTMVFTRTKRTAAKVADELTERGFAAAAVHGDLGQGAREQALRAFRSGKVDVLVATDVAARGIDVEDVTHVINYQCPEEDKTYIHRIGRTGRAGKTGIAVSFIDWDDLPRWKLINDSLGLDFAEPAETYSTSKHLYEDLNIPDGITGRLPSAQRVRAGLGAEDVEDLGETGGKRRKPAAAAGGPRHGKGQSRDHDARHEQDDAPGAAGDDAVIDLENRPARTRKPRNRTRGGRTGAGNGATTNGAANNGAPGSGSAPAAEAATTDQAVTNGADSATGDGSAPRRRRSRRRGHGAGDGSHVPTPPAWHLIPRAARRSGVACRHRPGCVGSRGDPEAARRRRIDRIVAAAIAVVVVAVGVLIYLTSDIRATTSTLGDRTPAPEPPVAAPTALSPGLDGCRTDPAVGAVASPYGVVVTADGSTVTGHDAVTGGVRWSYGRDDEPLCAVGSGDTDAPGVSRPRQGPRRDGGLGEERLLLADDAARPGHRGAALLPDQPEPARRFAGVRRRLCRLAGTIPGRTVAGRPGPHHPVRRPAIAAQTGRHPLRVHLHRHGAGRRAVRHRRALRAGRRRTHLVVVQLGDPGLGAEQARRPGRLQTHSPRHHRHRFTAARIVGITADRVAVLVVGAGTGRGRLRHRPAWKPPGPPWTSRPS